MHVLSITVDDQTYDILQTINNSFRDDGIERELYRLMEQGIAQHYTRADDGSYHRRPQSNHEVIVCPV